MTTDLLPRRWTIYLAAALAIAFTALLPTRVDAITGTADLTAATPEEVAQSLVGPGVNISNISYIGSDASAGSFSGGAASIGIDAGVTLSSGDISSWIGPVNGSSGTSTQLGTPGDADLTAASGFPTFDATVLSFDFTADAETIFFEYVFASEEYNEYVNTQFNDVFAFFVNGVNCATVPDGAGGTLPVAVNTVNNGNPDGDLTATNAGLYVDNTAVPNPYATELDGFTIPLTCMAAVNPAPATNTMKLAIADASDAVLDSAVFLTEGSLTTTPPSDGAKVTGGGRVDLTGGRANIGLVVIQDEQGLRGNLQLNDRRTRDRLHASTVTSLSVSGNTATWTGEGRFNGEDGFTFTAIVDDNRNGNAKKKGQPDRFAITVRDASGTVVLEINETDLRRGNLKIHDS